MVERTPKHVVFQYKCEDSTDLEIIIDGLDCDDKVVTLKPRRPGLDKAIANKLRFVTDERDVAHIVSRELSFHFVDYSRPAPFDVEVSPALEEERNNCGSTVLE